MIYLDSAATSHHRPPRVVARAVAEAMNSGKLLPGNAQRSLTGAGDCF